MLLKDEKGLTVIQEIHGSWTFINIETAVWFPILMINISLFSVRSLCYVMKKETEAEGLRLCLALPFYGQDAWRPIVG